MTSRIDRRSLLAGLAVAGLAGAYPSRTYASGAPAPGIAVTIDDFDLSETVLMNGCERDTAIRAALKRHRIKAGGFVAGKYVDAARSPSILAAWSDAGHIVGNHSFSHRYFTGKDPTG